MVPLEQLGKLDDIELVQKDSGGLLFIGSIAREGAGLDADHVRTVLQSFFRHGKAPGITIDPGPSPERMVVRYFGGIESTGLGLTFFEADRLFKSLSGGYDNYTCERVAERPPSLLTQLELMELEVREGGVRADAPWHRLWYEFGEEFAEVSPDGHTLGIPLRRLRVRVEAIPARASYPPSAGEFARTLTARFHELTMNIPALAELHRQAGLVLLGWWLHKWRISIDRQWLETPPQSVATPATTPAITATRATLDGRVYVRVGIYGGVDFQRPPSFRTRAGLDDLATAAKRARPPSAEFWDFEASGRRYRAVYARYTDPIAPLLADLATWSAVLLERLPSAPVPQRLDFPSLPSIGQQLADALRGCKPTTPGNLVLRGEAYVWDRPAQAVDQVAVSHLPEQLRATARTGQTTVFIVQQRRHIKVGTYGISGQPAFREDLTVSVHYWPQDVCGGILSLSADPPAQRPVRYVPEYGSVKLSEVIGGMRRE